MSGLPGVLVCGCRKYEEYLRAALRRLRNPNWILVGLVGSTDVSAAVWDEKSRIVTLPVPDTYEALPTKIHAAFTFASLKWPDAPGIYKTDDDIVYPSIPLLAGAIQKYKDEPFWGLFVGACPAADVSPMRIAHRFDDKTLTPRHQEAIYCYGHGYWVGRAAIPAILAAGDEYRSSYLEDVATGYVLNQAGFTPKRLPLLYSELPRGPALLNHV